MASTSWPRRQVSRCYEGRADTKIDWHFAKADTFVAPVVILNGEVFAAGTDGVLRAFVIPGNAVY